MADVLIFAGTGRSPELRHEVPIGIPDPFLYGGVRLEDLVLVTDDGVENLTDYPYELIP